MAAFLYLKASIYIYFKRINTHKIEHIIDKNDNKEVNLQYVKSSTRETLR